ncbi:MAG: BrnT family toxin [Lachnospiraceae bacterium]|nr:BrnT family toxin [Lachnospiraceae bacterium]
MKTIIGGHPVERDDQKNEINKNKHGISFETAALVFADENRIEYFDRLHSVEEDRYVVLGRVNDILFVVYTEREDASRLISARVATAAERRIYYGDC